MRKEARDFNKKLGSEFSKVFSGAAVAGGMTAALYGVGRAVTSIVGRAGRVNDLAEALQEMPADLVAVGGAAQLAGADMEAVNRAAVKLRVNLGKAADDDREMAETLKVMGLEASKLSRMSLPDMITELARGYQRAEQGGRGYLVVQTLMGRSATELIQLLQQAPEDLEEIFGRLTPKSNEAIQALDDLGDAWEELKIRASNASTDYLGGTVLKWRSIKKTLEKEGFFAAAKEFGRNVMSPFAAPSEETKADFRRDRGQKPRRGEIDPGGSAKAAEDRRRETDGLVKSINEARKATRELGMEDIELLAERKQALGEIIAQQKGLAVGSVEQLRLYDKQKKLELEIAQIQKKMGDEMDRLEEAERRRIERLKEEEQKKQEQAAGDAAKQRELALEAAIESLKEQGRHSAEAEARLRVEAAQKEYALAKGSKEEAEKYVALMAARNSLTEATSPDKGKSKNERIEEYMRDGMTSGEAKKKVRGEDKDARRAEARISAFRKGATEEADMVSGRDSGREYMDSHRNVSGAGAFNSGAWESGSHAQAVADAAAGKGAEGASGGDANGIGQLLQAVNELKQAIEKASGGGE